jgi:2-polyprenyl-6-methoxyphenol hydroxylase-like FAD-dependent oxidoreductase
MNDLTVLVVGGGIGGLALAQGLRKGGVAVEVYERDAAPQSRATGYRLHVNPAGSRALHALLPPPSWQAFVATAGPGGDFGLLTEQLQELVVIDESTMYPGRGAGPAKDHHSADRGVLRELLLAGLAGAVRFDAEFVRYEHEPDGRVAAVFADGHRAVGDLLVGADGASSRVRRQRLPAAEPVDAAVGSVGHKLYLTPATRAWVPPRLQRGMNALVVEGPVTLFTSVFDPPPGASDALRHATGSDLGHSDPYVLCGLLTGPGVLPDDVTELRTDALRHLVDGLVARWHPDLRRMLAAADPASRTAFRFTASPPVPPWPSSNVTLLGDAIHTMPPVGGLGGNTALRDASLLCRLLTDVARGRADLGDAVARYESEVRAHGDAAVRAALAARDQMFTGSAVATAAARTFLRLCGHVPALRRRTFTAFDAPARPRAWEDAA